MLASLETWPSGWIAGGASDYGTNGAKAGWAWGDYMDAADTFHGLRGPNSQANRQFFTHIATAGWNSANAAESHHCMVLTNNGGAWQSEDCESTSVKGYICMLECEWPPTQNVVATDVCLSALGEECDNGHISDFCGCPSEAAVIIAQNNDPYYTAPPPPPPAFPPGMAPSPPLVCGADSFTSFWDAGKTRSQAEVACRDHYRTLHGDPTLDRGFLAFPKDAAEQQHLWVLASLETWPSGWIAGGASDYGTKGAKAGWAWGDYMDAADTFHGLRGPNSQANRQFFTHIAAAGWNSANAAESHHCMVLTNNGGAWQSEDCESTSVKGYICMLECEWPPTQNVVATDVCLSALSEECDNGHISDFCGCPSEAAVIIAQNNDPYYTAPPPPPPAFPPGMAPSPPLVCGADSFTSFWDAGKTRSQAEVACRDHYRTLHGDPSLDRGFLAFPKDAAEQQQLWVLASLETWPSGWIAGGASDYGTKGAKAGWAWGDYMDAADTFHGLRGPNSQANRQFFTHIAAAGWNSANAAESHHCMVLTNNGGAWQSEDCESTSVKGYICMLECEWPPTQNVVATDVCLSALSEECDNGHISDFCGCPSEAAVIIAQNNDPYYTAPPPPPPAFPPGMAPSPPLVCGADSFTSFWDAGKTRSQAEVACRDHYRTLHGDPSLDRGFLAFPKDAAEQQHLWVLASLETWPSGWIAGGASDYGTKGAKAGWAWGDYMDAADTFHGLRGPNSQANRQFFTHIAAAGWNSANAAESHHCMVLTNNGGAWQSEDCESTSVKGYICMLECEWPPTQNVVATDVCLSALSEECDNGHISDFCGCPSEAAVIIAQNNDPYFNPSYANGRRLYGKDGYGYGDETEHYDEADGELARDTSFTAPESSSRSRLYEASKPMPSPSPTPEAVAHAHARRRRRRRMPTRARGGTTSTSTRQPGELYTRNAPPGARGRSPAGSVAVAIAMASPRDRDGHPSLALGQRATLEATCRFLGAPHADVGCTRGDNTTNLYQRDEATTSRPRPSRTTTRRGRRSCSRPRSSRSCTPRRATCSCAPPRAVRRDRRRRDRSLRALRRLGPVPGPRHGQRRAARRRGGAGRGQGRAQVARRARVRALGGVRGRGRRGGGGGRGCAVGAAAHGPRRGGGDGQRRAPRRRARRVCARRRAAPWPEREAARLALLRAHRRRDAAAAASAQTPARDVIAVVNPALLARTPRRGRRLAEVREAAAGGRGARRLTLTPLQQEMKAQTNITCHELAVRNRSTGARVARGGHAALDADGGRRQRRQGPGPRLRRLPVPRRDGRVPPALCAWRRARSSSCAPRPRRRPTPRRSTRSASAGSRSTRARSWARRAARASPTGTSSAASASARSTCASRP